MRNDFSCFLNNYPHPRVLWTRALSHKGRRDFRLLFAFIVIFLFTSSLSFAFNEDRALDFILKCRNVETNSVNLKTIFWRTYVFSEFGIAENDTYVRKHTDITGRCRNQDGGYGYWEKDVSSITATYYAIVTLRNLKSEIPEKEKVIDYLRKNFDNLITVNKETRYGENESFLYQCAIALNILGEKNDRIPEIIDIFKRCPEEPEGMYYYLETCRIFNVPVEDKKNLFETMKKRSDLKSNLQGLGSWNYDEQFYALRVLKTLNPDFKTEEFFAESGAWAVNWMKYLRDSNKYEYAMYLVEFDTSNSLKEPIKNVIKTDYEYQNGFSAIPGISPDNESTSKAQEALALYGRQSDVSPFLQNVKSSLQKDGSFRIRGRFAWMSEDQRKIDNTYKCLRIIYLSRDKLESETQVIQFLYDTIDGKINDLNIYDIEKLLLSLKFLNKNPSFFPPLIKGDTGGFYDKLSARLKSIKPSNETEVNIFSLMNMPISDTTVLAGNTIELLDYWWENNLQVSPEILLRKLKLLKQLNVEYARMDYFKNMIDSLQNPDGGFRPVTDSHSNLLETCSALHLQKYYF